jgi:hypothetical protein
MKVLDVSSITDSSEFPIKKGTLKFLQDAGTEAISGIVYGLIGTAYNPAAVYILWGAANSGSGAVYILSAGWAFYNGEVFQIDAATFTLTGSNVALFSLVTTQYVTNADPVTFTDAAVRNVHNIRKIVITQGVSGSGLANYTQGYFLNFTIPAQLNLTAPATAGTPYAGNQVQIAGVYPNINLFVSPASNLNPVIFAGSYNVGDADANPGAGGGTDFIIPFGSTLATASYYVMGSLISNGTPSTDSSLGTPTIRNRTTTGFTIHFREFAAGVQNVAYEYIIFAK